MFSDIIRKMAASQYYHVQVIYMLICRDGANVEITTKYKRLAPYIATVLLQSFCSETKSNNYNVGNINDVKMCILAESIFCP